MSLFHTYDDLLYGALSISKQETPRIRIENRKNKTYQRKILQRILTEIVFLENKQTFECFKCLLMLLI